MTTLIGPSLRRRAGLGALGTVFRTALLAILHTGGVERATNDVVTHTREILHAAAAHEHDGVFLQVVADARDVGGDFDCVRQADTGHLAQSGVRLFRRLGVHANAHAALFRAAHQRGGLGLGDDSFSTHPDKLRKRRHSISSLRNLFRRPVSEGGRYKPTCAQTDGGNSRLARRKKRESTRTGSKVYCESGETSKKLRTHSKRKNYAPGDESERLTRLFGAGAPFRPLFRPIPSNLFRDRRIPIHASQSNFPEWLLLLGENTP